MWGVLAKENWKILKMITCNTYFLNWKDDESTILCWSWGLWRHSPSGENTPRFFCLHFFHFPYVFPIWLWMFFVYIALSSNFTFYTLAMKGDVNMALNIVRSFSKAKKWICHPQALLWSLWRQSRNLPFLKLNSDKGCTLADALVGGTGNSRRCLV